MTGAPGRRKIRTAHSLHTLVLEPICLPSSLWFIKLCLFSVAPTAFRGRKPEPMARIIRFACAAAPAIATIGIPCGRSGRQRCSREPGPSRFCSVKAAPQAFPSSALGAAKQIVTPGPSRSLFRQAGCSSLGNPPTSQPSNSSVSPVFLEPRPRPATNRRNHGHPAGRATQTVQMRAGGCAHQCQRREWFPFASEVWQQA